MVGRTGPRSEDSKRKSQNGNWGREVVVALVVREGGVVLLAISMEFGKSLDWLLTGQKRMTLTVGSRSTAEVAHATMPLRIKISTCVLTVYTLLEV